MLGSHVDTPRAALLRRGPRSPAPDRAGRNPDHRAGGRRRATARAAPRAWRQRDRLDRGRTRARGPPSRDRPRPAGARRLGPRRRSGRLAGRADRGDVPGAAGPRRQHGRRRARRAVRPRPRPPDRPPDPRRPARAGAVRARARVRAGAAGVHGAADAARRTISFGRGACFDLDRAARADGRALGAVHRPEPRARRLAGDRRADRPVRDGRDRRSRPHRGADRADLGPTRPRDTAHRRRGGERPARLAAPRDRGLRRRPADRAARGVRARARSRGAPRAAARAAAAAGRHRLRGGHAALERLDRQVARR